MKKKVLNLSFAKMRETGYSCWWWGGRETRHSEILLVFGSINWGKLFGGLLAISVKNFTCCTISSSYSNLRNLPYGNIYVNAKMYLGGSWLPSCNNRKLEIAWISIKWKLQLIYPYCVILVNICDKEVDICVPTWAKQP